MPTKGIDRERLHKLTAMMDSPSRAEAIAAFSLALDELAKEQDARFSVEYNLGNPNAEQAHEEMERLRVELEEALQSVARHETTTKQLEEIIDRLHKGMAETDEHFQNPVPVQQPPVTAFDWGADNNDLTLDTPQPKAAQSGSFPWKTLGAWAYGLAVLSWLAIICLPGLRNSYKAFFLPLLWVIVGIPAWIYLRKVREAYGWIGVAVKVCLTADLLLVVGLQFPLFDRIGYPQLTTREQVFGFAVGFGLLWFLYSERFFSWVLEERKRTHCVVFPGAALILLLVVVWITGGDTKSVKASAPPQHFSQTPKIRKHHPAPKPTPPPDDDPQKLNYDFELPPHKTSSPILLKASYSSATDRPYLAAAAFQTSPSSDNGSEGGLVSLIVFVGFFALCGLAGESKKQKQKRYQKALDEANAPLPQNETGNAGHASTKDLKKRGWA